MIHYIDECWLDFVNAIVLSAVEDYRYSKQQLLVPSLSSKRALNRTRECERFFKSAWFELLTGLDGKSFFRRLNAQ